ncbi:pentatricopeptide repeat-containing protein [Tripterygium wilfordii]|uniref:Pentatricopeptide repeat-containing protein n=1 Tax=Tripterygium wilfordii TaxID=458696 RepID=A0A7J7CSR5_TRIWF|nr:pentatricopeptide repeat-containing protein At2g37320 [Tripterygium wilfordii]KAF5737130.1 pentatricopeptide repeat-containing protein [Tripterygium wilfordii]
MNTISNRKWISLAAFIQYQRLLSTSTPFPSQKLKYAVESKPVVKPLRIRDIVSPKTGVATNRQSHLCLIQEFLQRDPERSPSQTCGRDLSGSDSTERVFEEILESSTMDTNTGILDLVKDGLRVDASLLSNALSLCGSLRSIRDGVQYHCLAIRTGFLVNVYVGSALVSLYAKCGDINNAYQVFQEMPVRNVVSWTAIIAAFAQEWHVDMCLELYREIRTSLLKPNDLTLVSVLSACTGSGALGQGTSAHCQTIRMGFNSYVHIANALVSMYCKCGNVKDALCIFKSMAIKDVVSWNSMIAGYAQHGLAAQAIDLFKQMKKERVKPDAITFLGVLSSCRHAGLVEQGRFFFNVMVEHGVKAKLDHYSCVVDLLGRAGLLEEARELIGKMPMHPNAVIWGSLLSSCRLHGSVWIGIEAAESRLLLEPGCAATHVQLANLYSSARSWDQAARVRKLMKVKGLKTNPGCSWVEIKNEVFIFRAEDRSNARETEIIFLVNCLVQHMKALGYLPEMQEEDIDG